MADALIGEVLAVGEDVKLEVAKGDVVIFSKCVPAHAVAPSTAAVDLQENDLHVTELEQKRTTMAASPKELVDHAYCVC